MAEKSGSGKSTAEIKQEIARSRELVARDVSGLRYELDFPLKLRNSFQHSTVIWIGAAAVLGILFSIIPRGRKIYVAGAGKSATQGKFLRAGFLLGAARLAGGFLRPIVTQFILKKIGGARPRRDPRPW